MNDFEILDLYDSLNNVSFVLQNFLNETYEEEPIQFENVASITDKKILKNAEEKDGYSYYTTSDGPEDEKDSNNIPSEDNPINNITI